MVVILVTGAASGTGEAVALRALFADDKAVACNLRPKAGDTIGDKAAALTSLGWLLPDRFLDGFFKSMFGSRPQIQRRRPQSLSSAPSERNMYAALL